LKNLGWNKFANIAPNNPTQTRLTRLLRLPGGELKTDFSRTLEGFESLCKNGVKTDWDKYYGEGRPFDFFSFDSGND
jgi:hypothetical protein